METRQYTNHHSRRTFLRIVGGAVVIAAAGSLTACGGSASKSKTIKMTSDMRFEPASLTIKLGETVVWKNDNDMVHTATADPAKVRDQSLIELPAGAAPWDSGNVAQGGEWSHTFTTAGRYRYICLPHQIVGMVGEIVVEP